MIITITDSRYILKQNTGVAKKLPPFFVSYFANVIINLHALFSILLVQMVLA
ncbi:hypothetical protein IQ31_01080 [Sphingobacterium siyangense]|uniref:Uncharacterized protein n=1 Tax=Sphingobacterium siyangense TaxID=459529 RepID=A0A562MVW2_9SPHI|nr:hypothetical protein IQ31_01080 [Sphingobacterium siyangense]